MEAAVGLAIARPAIALVPFRWLARDMGQHMVESTPTDQPEHKAVLQRIAWAMAATSRHLPWECKCLAQALVAKRMLRRRKIPSTLYLGLAKDGKHGLEAHAWLRSGTMILTGSQEKDQFKIISTFA